jgi:hypothetical protein
MDSLTSTAVPNGIADFNSYYATCFSGSAGTLNLMSMEWSYSIPSTAITTTTIPGINEHPKCSN